MKDKSKFRVYLSGPMTDKATGKVSDENIIAFVRAQGLLKKEGYTNIFNPSRVWVCKWRWLYRILAGITSEHTAYCLVLLYDLWQLMQCDLIYKIPGWRESRGASTESSVAYHFTIWTLPQPVRERIDKKLVKSMEKWREKHAASDSPDHQ